MSHRSLVASSRVGKITVVENATHTEKPHTSALCKITRSSLDSNMSSTSLAARNGSRSVWVFRMVLFFVTLVVLTSAQQQPSDVLGERPAGRYITENNDPSVLYQVLLASFGNRLINDLRVNLMLPPDHKNDPYLCRYPEVLRNTTTPNLSEPVALLVAVGGPCSSEEKARIVLEMQQNVSEQIQVLILYETDRKYANWFISLAPDSEDVSPELDKVAILYFPFRHIPKMRMRLNEVKGNPLLLQPGNEDWSFQHTIEGHWVPIDPDETGRPGEFEGFEYEPSDDYYWIRYVLFSLLICSPCLRAAYLFYSGGGRLRFRRSESGRVVGLQLIPPMPFWLSQGRPPQSQEPINNVLTEEEFDQLPEIVYMPLVDASSHATNLVEPLSDSDDASAVQSTGSGLTESGDPELGRAGESTKAAKDQPLLSEDGEISLANDDCDIVDDKDEDDCSSSNINSNKSKVDAVPHYCRFSECSICIDEFEAGERLILLPRCQHPFHKDCIRPWLLERQGRCPLCKTCVIANEQETDESDGVSTNESQNGGSSDGGSEARSDAGGPSGAEEPAR